MHSSWELSAWKRGVLIVAFGLGAEAQLETFEHTLSHSCLHASTSDQNKLDVESILSERCVYGPLFISICRNIGS